MTTLYKSYGDAELTTLLRSGDLAAFTEIHSRYYGLLYSHAYKRFPDREGVKDILQELFTTLWNNRETIDLKTGLNAYLSTAVRNRILNVYRHEKIKEEYIHSFQNFLDTNTEPLADEVLRVKELVTMINAEVARMPPKMRRVFEMSRYENISYQEIAEHLDISVLTVRKQVQNSLKILRAKIGAYLFMFL